MAAALGAFAGAEWLERRAERPARATDATRMTIDASRRPGIERVLAIIAVVGGALAVVAGTPTRPDTRFR